MSDQLRRSPTLLLLRPCALARARLCRLHFLPQPFYLPGPEHLRVPGLIHSPPPSPMLEGHALFNHSSAVFRWFFVIRLPKASNAAAITAASSVKPTAAMASGIASNGKMK